MNNPQSETQEYLQFQNQALLEDRINEEVNYEKEKYDNIKKTSSISDVPSIQSNQRNCVQKSNLNVVKCLNQPSLRQQRHRVSIQYICPKNEGTDRDEEEDGDKTKYDTFKSQIIDQKRQKTKKIVFNSQNEDAKPNRSSFLFQRQFSINYNQFQRSFAENKNDQLNSSNLQQRVNKKQSEFQTGQSERRKEKAKQNLKRILRKSLALNNIQKQFAQIMQSKYVQKKSEQSLYPNIKTLNKSKYFDDLFLNKGSFPKDCLDPQSEFLKTLMNLPINMQNILHSDIAITILKKKLKSNIENQYLSRCLMNLDLFKQNQNILQDSASQKIIFSEINHVFFPKNTVIFNFGEYGYHYYVVLKGKVYCFIPKPERKEKLLNEQIEIERQVIKSKIAIPNQQQLVYSQSQSYSQQIQRKPSISSFKMNSNDSLIPSSEKLSPFLLNKSLINEKIDKSKKQYIKQQNKFVQTRNGEVQEDLIGSDSSNLDLDEVDILESISKLVKNNKQKSQTNKDQSKQKKMNEQTELINEDSSFQQQYFPDMNIVKIYSPGEAFGEIALMTKERRTASLVCKEDTHLMVLSKDGFDKILGSYQQSMIRQKVLFLKSFSFFETIANSQLMSLLHYFNICIYNQKSVIYSENDSINYVYFIRSGEVEIQKQVQVEGVVQPQVSREINNIQEIQANLLFNKNIQTRGKIQQKKIISIKILGPSQYFGQDEILSSLPKRQFRAIALQESEIYVINKKDLFSSLKQFKQMDVFSQQNDVKQQWQKVREVEATQLVSLREQVPKSFSLPQNAEQSIKQGTSSKQFSQRKLNMTTSAENFKNIMSVKIPKMERTFSKYSNTNSQQQNNDYYKHNLSQNMNENNFECLNQLQLLRLERSTSQLNVQLQLSSSNSSNINGQSSQTQKSTSDNLCNNRVVIFECKTLKTNDDEDDDLKCSNSKRRIFMLQQDLLNNKKMGLEKISGNQNMDTSLMERTMTHTLQLLQLQKINDQNASKSFLFSNMPLKQFFINLNKQSEIIKEIQKQKQCTLKQPIVKTINGLGFNLPFEQTGRQLKKEQAFSISSRSQQRHSKSLEKHSDQQNSSPVAAQNQNTNLHQYMVQRYNQKANQLKQNILLPFTKRVHENNSNYQNKNTDLSNNFIVQKIVDVPIKEKKEEQIELQMNINNHYYLSYQLPSLHHQQSSSKIKDQYQKLKSLNTSIITTLHDLTTKNYNNSSIKKSYKDDMKEDLEQNNKQNFKQNNKEDLEYNYKEEKNSTLSQDREQIQQISHNKNKKQNFISQFFQNNEVIKNRSIQKILKQQQTSQYIFKQIYNSPPTDKKKCNTTINQSQINL